MLHASGKNSSSKTRRRALIVKVITWSIGILSAITALVVAGTVVYRKTRNPAPQHREQSVNVASQSSPQGEVKTTGRGDLVEVFTRGGVGRREAPLVGVTGAALPAGGIENLDAKQPAIAQVVKEFFQAKSITELLPLVRDARRVRPSIESYYAIHPIEQPVWKGVGWIKPVSEPGHRFAYVQARFEEAAPVHVVVEETDAGFLVDWESSVLYSDMSWSEFQNTKPSQPKTFRVLASKVEEAIDKERGVKPLTFLKLRHPVEEGFVYGSFDPYDPNFRPLLEQLELCQWKDVPVILRLNYGSAAKLPNEVKIDGVQGKGWLILGSARG